MCAGFINQQDQQNVLIHPVRPPGELQALQVLDNIAAEMENIDHLRQRTIREMEKALRKQEELELDKVEETLTLMAMAAVHPITVTRALIQFGYEPFQTTVGPRYVFFGQPVVFLPNLFSYMRQLTKENKLSTLFEGLDSAICVHIVGGTVDGIVWKQEDELTDSESFLAVTVSRPFTVCLIRQIAQVIGNETKYTTCAQALSVIGKQEGPGGLFSGLAPQILGELLVIWGVHLITHGIQRAILRTEVGDTKQQDENKAKAAKDVHKFIHTAVPFVVNSFGYPYSVVSNVMAVAGSGLAVSFLPYSPSFNSWHGAWDYLRPSGLKRGSRLFLREQVGAVTVGADQQLYASNTYFA
ncbi:hypothetical protein CAEBREN_31412 [Caenorhabditis brenneri]|uniref:Uncharacterized protein n=1 Tax=Caenorhabditis brenneri TaxID=135651 RepID=G0N9E7_CAEBE|nr:hypothetical protein CAEBREN_31412 [Caenorhabditis brenneri]